MCAVFARHQLQKNRHEVISGGKKKRKHSGYKNQSAGLFYALFVSLSHGFTSSETLVLRFVVILALAMVGPAAHAPRRRRSFPPRPSRPVPSSSSVPASGVCVWLSGVTLKVTLPGPIGIFESFDRKHWPVDGSQANGSVGLNPSDGFHPPKVPPPVKFKGGESGRKPLANNNEFP